MWDWGAACKTALGAARSWGGRRAVLRRTSSQPLDQARRVSSRHGQYCEVSVDGPILPGQQAFVQHKLVASGHSHFQARRRRGA